MAMEIGTLSSGGGLNVPSGQLVRAIDWRGAFWVASGVPALVLFSIGGIAGVAEKLTFLVCFASMILYFLQSSLTRKSLASFPTIGRRIALQRGGMGQVFEAGKAGALPYLVLAAGLVVVLSSSWFFLPKENVGQGGFVSRSGSL